MWYKGNVCTSICKAPFLGSCPPSCVPAARPAASHGHTPSRLHSVAGEVCPAPLCPPSYHFSILKMEENVHFTASQQPLEGQSSMVQGQWAASSPWKICALKAKCVCPCMELQAVCTNALHMLEALDQSQPTGIAASLRHSNVLFIRSNSHDYCFTQGHRLLNQKVFGSFGRSEISEYWARPTLS